MEKRLKAAIESMSSDERAVALEQLQRIVGEIHVSRAGVVTTLGRLHTMVLPPPQRV